MHAMLLLALLAPANAAPLLFDGMGTWTRPASANEKAQRFFDQGLTLVFSFQHEEAVRSFDAAAALDPENAMVWWGKALAHGPHMNNPHISPEQRALAGAALDTAGRLAKTPLERDLVAALARRYVPKAGADRLYVDDMRALMKKHPDDVDIAVLWADAALTLQPWKTWTKAGKPEKGTLDVVTVLEAVLQKAPTHPGANHLLVHALEASPTPERATAAADRLRTLVPGAGHMVHMPSHIDVRTGRWNDAVEANTRAMKADAAYRKLRGEGVGFYGFYMVHNIHFLAYAAMMDGRASLALETAGAMRGALPPGFVESNAEDVDGFLALPVEVMVRFGKWDDILAAPEPDARLRVSRALRHHARGVALAVRGDVAAARAELASLRAEAKHVGERMVGLNKGKDVVAIADALLEGEIAVFAGDHKAGLRALERAVQREDALLYDEPPPWTLPTRHALGAALLRMEKGAEAERVYRADLERNKDNGWALTGLARALRMQKREADAVEVDARAKKAFARADAGATTTSSCHCLP
jgi:tetratricopeptide (TPR) repeat protein